MEISVNTEQSYPEPIKKLREQIERKTGKTPEQLYEEREKRIRDAIELKEPDRVPMSINPHPGNRPGLTQASAYYDPVAWKEAIRQDVLDFEPDMCGAGFGSPGLAWEALDVKNRLWPGYSLPPDVPFQFLELEYMKADEYELFMTDSSDFIVRYYLPRVYGALQPLSKLPPLSTLTFIGFEGITPLFDTSEFKRLAKALSRAGRETAKYRRDMGNAQEELALLGFPAFSHPGGVGGAPFDTVSSSLRGMKGSMLDMYQRPEKLLALSNMLLERRIARATPADPQKRGNPKRVGIPLWRGDKMFMSQKQFETFYWPGLKKALLTTIELGYVPVPFFEAPFGDRLECLLELPRGKFVASVDHRDVVRLKEILGDHCCIMSGGPHSLRVSSLREAEEYYKNLIKACGKGGGFILGVGVPDEGTLEDKKAMVESIKKYARY